MLPCKFLILEPTFCLSDLEQAYPVLECKVGRYLLILRESNILSFPFSEWEGRIYSFQLLNVAAT